MSSYEFADEAREVFIPSQQCGCGRGPKTGGKACVFCNAEEFQASKKEEQSSYRGAIKA